MRNFASMFGISLLVCVAVSVSNSAASAERTLPFYNDGFDTTGLLVENFKLRPTKAWTVKDGKLVGWEKAGATASLKKTMEGDCSVEITVTPLKKKRDFAGVIFRGINFLIRPNGFWYVYRVKGKKRSNGGMINAEIKAGKSYRFKLECRKVDKSLLFEWSVNGKRIARFMESGELESKNFFALFVNKMPMSYDNLAISKIVGADVSSNLLTNGSFEHMQEDLLLNWKPVDQGAMIGVYGSMENFWRTWRVDDKVAFDGKRSLRMEINDEMKRNGVYSHNVGAAVGQPIVYSVWLKADREDLPARLVYWEWLGRWHFKKIKISKKWKRYSFVLEKPEKNSIRVGLDFNKPGVVWMDAAQVESGTTPTPFKPSMLDDKFAEQTDADIKFPAEIAIPKLAKAPVLDGEIGTDWSGAVENDKFLIKGERVPTEKVESFVGCDAGNLYLAFRCHSKDVAAVKAKATAHDNGAIWGDDIVEVFIDTNLDRHSYFHLAVNSKGTTADVGPGMDLSWGGDWKAVSKTYPEKGYWETEMRIPLSILGLSGATSDVWGMNLCRSNPAMKEYSATALVPELNFHKVEWYGSYVWPKNILKAFALDVADLKLVELPGGGSEAVAGSIVNRTGRDLKVDLEFFAEGETVAKRASLDLPVDKPTAFSVPCSKKFPGGKDVKLSGKITLASGGVLTEFRKILKLTKGVEFFARWNYYMNESSAVLVGRLNLPDVAKLAATITLLDGGGKKVWSEKLDSLSDVIHVEVPIEKLPVGTHTAKIVVMGNGKTLATSETSIVKRPYQANGVRIDRERLCVIVDGKPFLPIAPLVGFFGHTKKEWIDKQVAHFAKAGFKTMMTVMGVKYKTFYKIHDEVEAALERCDMKWILWPAGFRDKNFDPVKLSEAYGKAKPLIAWMPVDEPELYAKPKEVVDCVAAMHAADKYHPVITNNTVMGIPARFAGLTNDILSIDDYLTNRPNRKVSEILEQVAQMARVGAEYGKPCFMFLVGNNLHNHAREPSAGEQVAQSYGTIISGACGIYYFLGQPTGRKHWEVYKRTNRELLELTQPIFSLERTGSAVVADKSIIQITRKYKGCVYVISVNIEPKTVETAITLPLSCSSAKTAEVMFENQSASVAGGKIKATYKPFERKVFKIKAVEAGASGGSWWWPW